MMMKYNKQIIYYLLIGIFIINCADNKPKDSKIKSNDWQVLFDGTSLAGWRAFNSETLPEGWSIVDNTMTFTREKANEKDYDYTKSRDIIYGSEQFENFELYVEWKIPVGGNSGIFYHIQEGYSGFLDTAPEYQIIDDMNYADLNDLTEDNIKVGFIENPSQLHPLQKTASDYAMYPALAEKNLNPAGEWNSSRIVYTPKQVVYYLNGEEMLSFQPNSEEWKQRKATSKWKDYPDYAKFNKGYIGFQDHGSGLAFRNIKIRKL